MGKIELILEFLLVIVGRTIDVIAFLAMIPDEALTVLNHHNTPNLDTYKGQFAPRKQATGVYASLHRAALSPVIGGDINQFRQLITFLGSDVTGPEARRSLPTAYNMMVESEGGLVGISGFIGRVFLFGRYDGPGSELGLSSCYFVFPDNRDDKLDPDKTSKVWKLRSHKYA